MDDYGITQRVGDAGNTEYTLNEMITIYLPLKDRDLFYDDSYSF